MTTIKSYSDLYQSKKLAKILPLESADMHYNVVGDVVIGDYQSGMSSARSVAKAYKKNPDEFAKNVTPCWSLAALLEALPYPTLYQQRDGAWGLDVWVEQVKPYSVKNAICEIDACYEMILKLHELKML